MPTRANKGNAGRPESLMNINHVLIFARIGLGAFEDEVARFGPGDVEMADEDLDHQPIAVEGEDCICLAVTDAPLKFQTFVHKLVQPFLKI